MIVPFLVGLLIPFTGWLTYSQLSEPVQNALGAFGDPFISIQLADSPQDGYILSTDGTDNSWIANSSGSTLWSYTSATDVLSPIIATTSNTARITASSFHATSTATSSVFNDIDFTNASGTGITATNFWGALVGNADTATALAANGANCSSGNAPLGVDASGAVESCFDVWTEAENTSAGYISGNETITLSGDVSGSGATSITTAIGTDVVAFGDIDNSATLAGNLGLGTNDSYFGDNGILFEGATADNFEGLLTSVVASSDKTWTLPNTTGTIALLTSAMTGTFDGNNFGGGAIGQGDILYGSAAGTISELAKDTNATRYLSNQGTSNNPSWNQVNLANGVTGTLGVASLNTDYGDFTCNGSACTLDTTPATSLDTAYNGGQSITADSGAVAITVPDTSSNAGLTITQNDVTNNPVALAINSAINGADLTITNTNASTVGGRIELYHDSASPATSDNNYIEFSANSDMDTKTVQGAILGVFDVLTDGSEEGGLEFWATSGGAEYNGGLKALTDSSGSGILSSLGNEDLILQTGNGTTGNITLTDGANGPITLTPNGTGRVVCGFVCRAYSAASATLSTVGDFFVDSTSGQFQLHNGTETVVLPDTEDKSFTIASSTLAYYGAYGSSGTTTLTIWHPSRAVEVVDFYATAVSGTSTVGYGDGTNFDAYRQCGEDVPCDAAGSISNGTFTDREGLQVSIGNQTGDPDYFVLTFTIKETAD